MNINKYKICELLSQKYDEMCDNKTELHLVKVNNGTIYKKIKNIKITKSGYIYLCLILGKLPLNNKTIQQQEIFYGMYDLHYLEIIKNGESITEIAEIFTIINNIYKINEILNKNKQEINKTKSHFNLFYDKIPIYQKHNVEAIYQITNFLNKNINELTQLKNSLHNECNKIFYILTGDIKLMNDINLIPHMDYDKLIQYLSNQSMREIIFTPFNI